MHLINGGFAYDGFFRYSGVSLYILTSSTIDKKLEIYTKLEIELEINKNLEYELEIDENLENFESNFEFFVNFEFYFEFFVISSFLSMVDELTMRITCF